jgi:hypothetical protein
MASITQLKSGNFRVMVRKTGSPSTSTTFKTLKEAEDFASRSAAPEPVSPLKPVGGGAVAEPEVILEPVGNGGVVKPTLMGWKPRWYYVLRNKTSGKKYLGQTLSRDFYKETYCGSGRYWVRHCEKHGGHNRDNIEVVWREWFKDKKRAEEFLDFFKNKYPDYAHYKNRVWANLSYETTNDSPFSGLKGLKLSDDHIAKKVLGSRKMWEDQSYRQRMSESVKAGNLARAEKKFASKEEALSTLEELKSAELKVAATLRFLIDSQAKVEAILAELSSAKTEAEAVLRELSSPTALRNFEKLKEKLKTSKPVFSLQTKQFFVSSKEAKAYLSKNGYPMITEKFITLSAQRGSDFAFRYATEVEHQEMINGTLYFVRRL